MTSTACMVAVDVGNTAVKLAVEQGDAIVDHSIVISHTDWHQSAITWVRDRLGCKDMQWRIASVHQRAADRLVDAVRIAAPSASIELVTHHDVPMPVAVDFPDRLGIDRLLSAFQARRITRDSSPNSGSCGPLVVIDAGSAVTVDWVDGAGRFCGGAILPGLSLQSRALAMGTDALPQIDWSEPHQVRIPATNTADAIYAGILVGLAAAIDGLTQRYIESWQQASGSDDTVPVILTGGDSLVLSAHLRHAHHQKPNLVCRGLLNLSSR
ncbi:Type III pantothenate kinase [Rubripirellula tenax]|uniref:Type III pantothenate kinase n=1 Tax=Rubripirellula tenax TaxID=2528015 RepID=A0A5C6F9B6_9BACT|nr:type III pantothenate kinase [Rubripirellula tenax]TWU57037.1 Type III pantothenate kinase [Rubripirellula tenax]